MRNRLSQVMYDNVYVHPYTIKIFFILLSFLTFLRMQKILEIMIKVYDELC